jgi:uncharacterized membrane protein YdfJ with MMPL/SSD domain
MRLFGFGLTVGVLVDATLVRMLLVPDRFVNRLRSRGRV